MSQARRDKDVEQLIKAAVLGLFGDVVEEAEVRAGEDPNEKPALFMTVFLKPGQKPLSSAQWLDAIAAANSALRAIDDDRFVYVTFLAPEYRSAEDTRPAA